MIRCYRTSVQRRRIYCHISPRRREGREGKRKEPKARSFLEFGPIARCLCLTASVTEGPKLSRVKSSWPVDCGLNCLPRTRLGPQEQENKNKKSHKYYSLIQVTQLNSQSKTPHEEGGEEENSLYLVLPSKRKAHTYHWPVTSS